MKPGSTLARAGIWAVLAWAAVRPAASLPTMVRLGYPQCVSCHISPQGGGLLNAYGRGIDQAQSLRAGEYKPSENRWARKLSWGGRITQDVRMLQAGEGSDATNQPAGWDFRTRLLYRNVTQFGSGVRLSAIVTGENQGTARTSTPYESAIRPGRLSLSAALVHYRPREGLEFAAGRDLLPTGIYVSDLAPFIKSRNRLGYYDTPTQMKMYWWGKRHQISPFAFGPSGNERAGEGERGGGTLAEFDLLGKQRTILGVSLLRGSAANGSRRLLGAYTRLGFGSWGVLAEHDVTKRTISQPAAVSFGQNATYAQLFWAAREWLVFSVIGERLAVGEPFAEDLRAGKLEVAARLTSNFTIGLGTRIQRNVLTGAWAPSIQFQLAAKTVN